MLRKLGSYGAFLQALSYITLLILWMAIYPSEGATDETMMNMSLFFNFALGHAALLKMQFILDIAFAAGAMWLTLALFRRFRSRNIDVALLILGTGVTASLLFLTAGIIGLYSIDTLVQLSGGTVSQAFIAYLSIQGGVENAAIFAGGWSMFFIAWAGMQAKSWKNWMTAFGFLGAAGGVSLLPFWLVAPQLMAISMVLGICGMIFNFGLGFSLSSKATEQAFELEPTGAR